MEVAPRTRILGAVPKVPETFCTDTPATWPSRERLISAIPLSLALSASTLAVEPVINRRSTCCIPVATAASSTSASSARVKLTVAATGFRASLKPRLEATIYLAEPGTLAKVYLPSMSVMVPTEVFPSTKTATPGTGSPLESTTVPLTDFVWPRARPVQAIRQVSNRMIFCFPIR